MRNKLRSMLYRGLAVALGILMAVPFGQLEAKAAAAMSQSDAVT